MECRVKPYEGTEARAAVIHVGGDDAVVFPFIERLSKCGLRIWHDAAARKVMVEYRQNWKKQQELSGAYLVFLSPDAVNSHVFRERFTSVVESRRPFIVIDSLGQEAPSPGMKLQIGKAEHVFQINRIPGENLAGEIVGLQVLKNCVGEGNPGMEVSPYPDGPKKNEESVSAGPERIIAPSDRTMMELQGTRKVATPVQKKCSDMPLPVLLESKIPETQITVSDNKTSPDETIRISAINSPIPVNPDETIVLPKVELPIIISLMSGERKKGILGEAVVGRIKKIPGAVADIAFTDECRLFSGKHFSLIYIDNICMLICKHPNGMNVNGQEMSEGDKYAVESEAIVQIPSNSTLAQLDEKGDHLTYLLVVTGNRAAEYGKADAIAFLKSEATGEIRCFTDQFEFGRGNAWKTGAMASRNISRKHGTIVLESGRFFYRDHSVNGTMINGRKISDESLELHNDDIISVLGDDQNEESFVFHSCMIRKG